VACSWPCGIARRVVMSSSRCPWLRTMRAGPCAARSRVPSNDCAAAARAAASRDDLAARALSATHRQKGTAVGSRTPTARASVRCAPQQRGRRWPRELQRHGAPSAHRRAGDRRAPMAGTTRTRSSDGARPAPAACSGATCAYADGVCAAVRRGHGPWREGSASSRRDVALHSQRHPRCWVATAHGSAGIAVQLSGATRRPGAVASAVRLSLTLHEGAWRRRGRGAMACAAAV
jgi:hypothetical protein